MRKIHITRLVTIVGAIAVSTAAFAADKKDNITDPATLQKFENVRVVNVAPVASKPAQSSDNMRAFIDPETGALRAPTAADFAQAAPAAAKSKSAGPAARSAATQSSESAGPVSIQHADGSTSVALDESFMSYSVARVGADGKVTEDCVTGKDKMEATLKAPVAKAGVDRHEK